MNKELEALNELRYGGLVKDNVVCFTKTAFEKRLDIIETALKDHKNLKEENKLLRENNENLDENYFDTWSACERLKENNNYALMFIDNIYCLVDTKDNKFEVIDNYKINNKGIIDNKIQKKLKALESQNGILLDQINKRDKILQIIKELFSYEEINVEFLEHHNYKTEQFEYSVSFSFNTGGYDYLRIDKEVSKEQFDLLKEFLK